MRYLFSLMMVALFFVTPAQAGGGVWDANNPDEPFAFARTTGSWTTSLVVQQGDTVEVLIRAHNNYNVPITNVWTELYVGGFKDGTYVAIAGLFGASPDDQNGNGPGGNSFVEFLGGVPLTYREESLRVYDAETLAPISTTGSIWLADFNPGLSIGDIAPGRTVLISTTFTSAAVAPEPGTFIFFLTLISLVSLHKMRLRFAGR